MSRKNKSAVKVHAGSSVSSDNPVGSRGAVKRHANPAIARADEIRTSANRETIEAFVVAFILALLFRAFIAEAFVIPTGSMAPTLMGAHKDISCDRCGKAFRTGASLERRGADMEHTVVGSICPNCRHVNSLDLAGNVNHATFSGDRILVSKFAYTLADPERWDVIVFKFPGNPKQNYIKRLVGLPNETLTIRHGDVYVRPTGSEEQDTIVRKPPETLLAMRHHVYDTAHQSTALINAGYPARWQPWSSGATAPPIDSWQLQRTGDGMSASLQSENDERLHWLRYFHRWPDRSQWKKADDGLTLADVDPYSSRLITDFYAYDSYIHVPSRDLYDEIPSLRKKPGRRFSVQFGWSEGSLSSNYESGGDLDQFGRYAVVGAQGHSNDGLHWVGDLIMESDIETSADAKEIKLEIVEAGVQYHCSIDLTSGSATLGIEDVEPRAFGDGDASKATANTPVRAGQRHQLRFSNCDDQLLLWVDGDVISFDIETTFDSRLFRPDSENFPRYVAAGHPLDAAPVGVAVRGGSSTIHSLRIDRDKYYIASDNSMDGLTDYDLRQLRSETGQRVTPTDIQAAMAQPSLWDQFKGWDARRTVTFEMEEDQFFPMGDNSPESQDARCWAGVKQHGGLPPDVAEDAYRWADAHYVPRDLLVGKALMVFWPHPWNSPVPFTPNVKRMKLIR
tara:strand:+ start:370883 stop:372916 length:2034 start_codon:yes stop_codon:yes gene_type:complete